MTCALCLKQEQLRNSHIIPEFMYGALYDDLHRFHVLTTREGEKNQRIQQGLREYLLCDGCERLLQTNERYASLVFNGGAPISFKRDGNILFLSGLDYTKFKLFQMSILWRAGVASANFFERVKLGPHQEYLRSQILAGDPGPPDRYACLMWGLAFEPGKTPGLMVQPSSMRIQSQPGYRFVIGGVVWDFSVSSMPIRAPLSQWVLQRNGDVTMQVRHLNDLQPVSDFVQNLNGLGRFPKLK